MAIEAVARLLGTVETRGGQAPPAQADNWAMRVLAAQAMGRLGAGSAAEASRHLRLAAVRDTYALVREAALIALSTFDAAGARELGGKMAESDPEPRVRETAQAIAKGKR
jgi:hypothetical protein